MSRKLLIDAAPGVDDAIAPRLALGSRDVDVVGLTTTFGNIVMKRATRNVLSLLAFSGRGELPVAPLPSSWRTHRMPSLLFHQDMAGFSGTNAIRNDAFHTSFLRLQKGLPAGHMIDVAGFTGLVNDTSAPDVLADLAASLMDLPAALPPPLYTVACGRGASSADQKYR
ncbi:nucleoside hydrolase, partial [Archangium violaceum]